MADPDDKPTEEPEEDPAPEAAPDNPQDDVSKEPESDPAPEDGTSEKDGDMSARLEQLETEVAKLRGVIEDVRKTMSATVDDGVPVEESGPDDTVDDDGGIPDIEDLFKD